MTKINIIDKNNYYHTILSILRQPISEEDKAKEIVLYLQDVISNKQLEEQEEQETPAKFKGSFRRV